MSENPVPEETQPEEVLVEPKQTVDEFAQEKVDDQAAGEALSEAIEIPGQPSVEEQMAQTQQEAAQFAEGQYSITPPPQAPQEGEPTALQRTAEQAYLSFVKPSYDEAIDTTGLSLTQAAVAGFVNSISSPLANLDQGPLYGIPGGIAEGTLRGGFETINLIPDVINWASGTSLPRINSSEIFDPGGQEASTGADVFTGLSQFMSYFLPIGGGLGKLARGGAEAVGLGRVSMQGVTQGMRLTRVRGLTAVNAAGYAGQAVVGGMATDFLVWDAADGGLATMIKGTEWSRSLPSGVQGLLDFLDTKEYLQGTEGTPGDRLYARFKLSLEGAAIGGLFDAGLTRLAGALRPVGAAIDARNLRKTREAIVETHARLMTRMKLAEDFIAGGGDPAKMELHLNEAGYGLDTMRQEYVMPAYAQALAESFDVPLSEARLLANMFVNAGGDLNRLFVPGRGQSTLGDRLPMFMQRVRDMEAQRLIAETERGVALDRQMDVISAGGTPLTALQELAERGSQTVTGMRGRAANQLRALPVMTKEDLEAAVERLISEGKMSRDEYYYGGYQAFVDAAKPGEIIDPAKDIANRARGVGLYEHRLQGRDVQYGNIRPQGESRNYTEILIGGDPSRAGDNLLPPGYYLIDAAFNPETASMYMGTRSRKYVLKGPGGVAVEAPQFTSELDAYAYFTSRRGRADALKDPALRDYYGLMQQRHFTQEGSAPILAHMRLSERTLPDGRRVLYVEEMQSDFYNELTAGVYEGGARGEPSTAAGYGLRDPQTGQPSGLWRRLAARRLVAYARENGFDHIVVPDDTTVGRSTSWSPDVKRVTDPEVGFPRDLPPKADPLVDLDPATDLGQAPPEPGPLEDIAGGQMYAEFAATVRREANVQGAANPKKTPTVEVEFGTIDEGPVYKVVGDDGTELGSFRTQDEADNFINDLELDASGREPVEQFRFDDETGEMVPVELDEMDEWADVGANVVESRSAGTRETGQGRLISVPEGRADFLELFQADSTTRGQAFVDTETGNAFIRGVAGDTSTLAHELGHALHVQMLARNNADEIALLDRAFGIGPDGWTVDKYEEFARSLEAYLRDPTGVTPEQASGMATIAASMRDIYTDIKGTPLEGKLTDEHRAFFDSLALRTDLPIQYAPGKFMPAADWSTVISRIREIESSGEDWRTILSPEDLLATAKYKSASGGPVRNAFFDMENEDDMLKALAVFESLYRNLQREGIVSAKMTADERGLRAIQHFSDLTGRDMNEVMNELAIADARNVGQGAINVEAGLMMMNLQLKKVMAMRDAFSADPSTVNEAKFHRAVMQFQMIHRLNAQLRYQAGSTLRQYRRTGDFIQTDEALSNAETANGFIDVLGDTAGTTRELAKALSGIPTNDEGMALMSRMITGVSQATTAQQAKSILNEIYINGLLSSPKTIAGISTVSPLLSMMFDGMGRLAGAMSQRDLDTAAEVLQNTWRNIANSAASARHALAVVRNEQPVLLNTTLRDDPGATRGAIGRHMTEYTRKGETVTARTAGHALQATGRVVRAAQTGIATFDEFFKQLNARTHVQAQLLGEERLRMVEQAVADGDLPPNYTRAERQRFLTSRMDELTRRAEARFDDHIRDGRLRGRQALIDEAMSDPVIAAMDNPRDQLKAAREYVDNQQAGQVPGLIESTEAMSRRHVFQEELGEIGRTAQRLLDMMSIRGIPIGRVIVPFFRTPVNLLKRFPEFLPTALAESTLRSSINLARGRGFQSAGFPELLTIHRQYMRDMASPDAAVRAAAEGKQAVGLGLIATAYAMHEAGNLTGSGPENPALRRTWLTTNQDYSIRLGDNWVSYKSLDPFAYHLGIMADTFQYLELAENEDAEIGLFGALMYATIKQFESKSYLQGASELFKAMEHPERAGTFVRNLASSAVPFSSFQRTVSGVFDPVVRENRTVLDAITSQSLLFDPLAAPRRTVLGEEAVRVSENTSVPVTIGNLVNPLRAQAASKDPIYLYLSSMESPPDLPAKTYMGVDWTKIPAPPGQAGSAWDDLQRRVGEVSIGGVTLRTRLSRLLDPKGAEYDTFLKYGSAPPDTPGGRPPFEEQIVEIIQAYRDVARQQAIDANPRLAYELDIRQYEVVGDALDFMQARGNTKAADRLNESLRRLGRRIYAEQQP